jgi:SAM-dependent methyltransferase
MTKNQQAVKASPSPDPSAWIARFAPDVSPGGSVLDVACGSGRHSRLFASLGHPVTAIDRDISRLTAGDNITTLEVDLEDGTPFPLAGRQFDAVVVTNYLWRALFGDLVAALKPGGVLIYETFALGNEKFGKPRNPDFLLAPGELLEIARDHNLLVLAYEHGEVNDPAPSVRQRIFARKL